MKPFLLTPAWTDYLWGGSRLNTEFSKNIDAPVVAETWELSAHPDGPSTVAGGEFAGMSFREWLQAHPEQAGTKGLVHGEFPVLIKLIDADKDLSVQVHPDDAYGARVEGSQGKTEMWVVLSCRPGAFLYCGFSRVPDRDELERRIRDGSLTEILGKKLVKPGDVFFIPAGTIHAIGAGIVVAEIQQNSNTTYRVYDYGRKDKDGNQRELHVEKALDVIALEQGGSAAPGETPMEEHPGYAIGCLASCPYFTVRSLRLREGYHESLDGSTFVSLLCTGGAGVLKGQGEEIPFQKGQCLFVPASCGAFDLEGRGEILLTSM